MLVFTPISITDDNMTSPIPEPDTSMGEEVWVDGDTYETGDQVIKTETHKIYQSATDGNTDDPEIGVELSPQTWVEVSSTNRYRMFDEIGNAKTEWTESLTITISPGTVITSIAGFGIESIDTIEIVGVDPTDGEIYNKTVNLRDSSGIFGFYEYFFNDIESVAIFVVRDITPYKNATFTITFYSDTPMVGVLALGKEVSLGTAEYGSSFDLNDYSTVETDDFGYFTIVQRETSKNVDFQAYCQTDNAQFVFDKLSDLVGIPAVWYGSGEDNDSTLVYGYYSSSTITVSNPSTSAFTLSIEGLT